MPGWTTETLYEIWSNDGEGYHYEVGEDRDGLDGVEVRSVLDDGVRTIEARMSFTADAAEQIGQAILKVARKLKEQSNAD